MSCTSPRTVASTIRPLPDVVAGLHVRLEVRDGGLHHFGGLQDERQLHLPGPEQLADGLHARQQRVVDDLQGGPLLQGRVEVVGEAGALAVDDPAFEAVEQRQRGQLFGARRLRRRRADALEQGHQLLQRVVAFATAVVDEVEGDRALVVRDPRHRQDLRRVHDRGVQSRLDTLVQEHGVEHLPRGRVEAEGDVRQAERGLDLGVTPLDLADRLDRLDAVAARLLLAGGDGEGERVDDDVGRAHAPLPGDVGDQPGRDVGLLPRGPRLALFVDGQGDDGGAVLADQLHDLGEAGLGSVAVLVVDGVDRAAAAEPLQARAEHGDFGGVEHDRQGGRGGQAPGQLGHVRGAVAADVVDAEVEQVGAVAGLLAGDLDAVVPAALQHRVPERLRAVGVGPLADHQHAGVLLERHRLVQRRHAGLGPRPPGHRRRVRHCGGELPDVLVGGAAATADQADAELADEPGERLDQRFRAERVHRAVRAQLGQAGVRHHRQRHPGVLGQLPQVLAHLGRSGGAVEPDGVDAERLQRGQRGADLRAEQHRAGRFDGDRSEDRHLTAFGGHRPLRADDRRLGLEDVLGGLDDHRVDAAGEQAADFLAGRRHAAW